jgi:hypothetical protein
VLEPKLCGMNTKREQLTHIHCTEKLAVNQLRCNVSIGEQKTKQNQKLINQLQHISSTISILRVAPKIIPKHEWNCKLKATIKPITDVRCKGLKFYQECTRTKLGSQGKLCSEQWWVQKGTWIQKGLNTNTLCEECIKSIVHQRQGLIDCHRDQRQWRWIHRQIQ